MGELREICLDAFRVRDDLIPGYAIGGLSGGEEKESFVQIVDFCCKALPDLKPRYLMGVGYPLDIVLCTALGVDMYDCVYPTRTARFGAALIHDKHPGTIRLKNTIYRNDNNPISKDCNCQACKYYTRSQLHYMLKKANGNNNESSLGVQLMTHHNLCFMMNLMNNIRIAIQNDKYNEFVYAFVQVMFPDDTNNEQEKKEKQINKVGDDDNDNCYSGKNIPIWV